MIRWLFDERPGRRAFLAEHATGAEELRRRAVRLDPRAGRATASGVPAAEIEASPGSTPRRSPAVLRCGWGLERNRNGGSAVAAVLALPAVAGKFGVRGGGYTLSNSSAPGTSCDRRRPFGRARAADADDQHEPPGRDAAASTKTRR